MASSNHLLMVFIAVELASLHLALAGFSRAHAAKARRALNYVVYDGGGSPASCANGISLLRRQVRQPSSFPRCPGIPPGPWPFDLALAAGHPVPLPQSAIAFQGGRRCLPFWCPRLRGGLPESRGFLSVASRRATRWALLARLTTGTGLAGRFTGPPRPRDLGGRWPSIWSRHCLLRRPDGDFSAISPPLLSKQPQTACLAYATIAHACLHAEGAGRPHPTSASAALLPPSPTCS